MSVPNQKIVQIAPRIKRDSDHLYAMMNIDALSAAVQDLKGSGLKMWLYFNKNQDGYKFELSQKACQLWGIKKDSYYDGIRELESKGYLFPIYEGSNIYKFYETPPSEKPKVEKPPFFSETDIPPSGFEKMAPDFPQRNNTNNTRIIQNKTIEELYHLDSVEHTDFAVGKIGGCGKAASVKEDNYERFGDMPREKQEYLKSLGF